MPATLKTLFYNLGYSAKEVKTSIRLSFVTSLVSAVSIGLILFILATVISGWWISRHFIDMISQEAEISIFWEEDLSDNQVTQLAEQIEQLEGIKKVRRVSAEEAYDKMAGMLGPEADILKLFELNPFTPYLEINLDLDKTEPVVDTLNRLPGIAYVRDNQEILNRLHSLSQLLGVMGYLGLAAVALTTLIIISHIIKLSIYARRSQIQTLELLGASKGFIAFPFLLEGCLIAFMGGLLATALIVPSVKLVHLHLWDLLPFLPLPPSEELTLKLAGLLWVLSVLLGLIGSIIGLSSTR